MLKLNGVDSYIPTYHRLLVSKQSGYPCNLYHLLAHTLRIFYHNSRHFRMKCLSGSRYSSISIRVRDR